MVNKKVDLNDLIKRIDHLEERLEKLDPTSKRKLPSKKDQIKDIKENIGEWSKKFPSVDIEFELAKMLDWLKANNKRKKDYKAFFRNWLRKTSNSMEVNKEEGNHSYVFGCNTKECETETSTYKDMYFFCEDCGKEKKIIKIERN
tara:strand:- start:4008 stop:4442 length:435 start_codon:yes stop_codon:yes gene_type:complete